MAKIRTAIESNLRAVYIERTSAGEVNLHAEISVRAVNDCSKRPAAIFVWFVPSTRNFLAKAVYMVLESS